MERGRQQNDSLARDGQAAAGAVHQLGQALVDDLDQGVRRHAAQALGDLNELARLAVDETVILLHPAPPLVDVLTVMERERQQNNRIVNG